MRNLTCFLLALVLAAPSTARAQYFEHDPDDPKQNAPIREGERALIQNYFDIKNIASGFIC